MSLVNDALRRATEAQKKINTEPPKLPLRPAAASPEEQKGMGIAWPLSLGLFVGAVCLIGWLNQTETSLPVKARTPAVEVAKPSIPATPAPAIAATPSVSLTNPPTPVIEPVIPKPAPLKLQAVLFNPRNPSAIIDGKTVFVGDKVRDLRVAAIASNSALLISATQTNLLTLE